MKTLLAIILLGITLSANGQDSLSIKFPRTIAGQLAERECSKYTLVKVCINDFPDTVCKDKNKRRRLCSDIERFDDENHKIYNYQVLHNDDTRIIIVGHKNTSVPRWVKYYYKKR